MGRITFFLFTRCRRCDTGSNLHLHALGLGFNSQITFFLG